MKKLIALSIAAGLFTFGCEKAQDAAPAAEAPATETAEKPVEGAAKADEKPAEEAEKPAEVVAVTVGQPAPEFELKDETGKVHKLSDYKGKVVVLEWTNPDCPFVERHYKAKTMQSTWDKVGGKDKVVWLAVDSSHFVKPEDSNKWKTTEGFEHAVLQDADGKVGQAYQAKTTPHMFVVDAKGILAYQGAIDSDPKGKEEAATNYVEQAVTSLLEGKEVETKSTKPYGCSVKFSS